MAKHALAALVVLVALEGAPTTADLTVGDVAHRYSGTLDTMKQLGINHCCGANLTLREAAASAGVALEALLQALNRPAVAVR